MGKVTIMRPDSSGVKAMIAEAVRIDAGLLAMQNSEKRRICRKHSHNNVKRRRP